MCIQLGDMSYIRLCFHANVFRRLSCCIFCTFESHHWHLLRHTPDICLHLFQGFLVSGQEGVAEPVQIPVLVQPEVFALLVPAVLVAVVFHALRRTCRSGRTSRYRAVLVQVLASVCLQRLDFVQLTHQLVRILAESFAILLVPV